jgi:hypothetical protein
MKDIARMAEDHIRAHEARLRHVDELLEHARHRAGALPEYAQARTELDHLIAERDRLALQVDDLRARAAGDWQEHEIEESGLMGIWDALAQQIEKLVERLER